MKKATLILLFFIANQAIAQCPMCRSAVESSMNEGSKSVGMGLNSGILFMLGTVYLVLFSVGFMWYKKYKANQQQHA